MPASGSADPGIRSASRVRGFPPIVGASPRLLILGSMPGAASLAAARYYAHPRNAFWPIMGELFGARPDLPYDERVAMLAAAGVAVWDVLGSCVRTGSLDADIDHESLAVNDLAAFLNREPTMGRLLFNGATAATLFRRHVLPTLSAPRRLGLQLYVLPSTSPANAAWTFARKLAAWREAISAP